jgi:hypothetical protein
MEPEIEKLLADLNAYQDRVFTEQPDWRRPSSR